MTENYNFLANIKYNKHMKYSFQQRMKFFDPKIHYYYKPFEEYFNETTNCVLRILQNQ